MRIYKWGSLIVGLGLLLSVRVAVAQSTFASIVGTVQDSTGAFVAQSSVTLRNTEENISQTKTTNESGEFLFLNLKPGKYEVRAEKAGFSRTLATGIQIDARQERRVSLRLSVESVGQTVEVTESVTTINTENATIADTKDGQQVIGLPVNYRGATTSPLAALVAVPGVQQDSGGALSIGGGLPSTIEFSLDGISTANVRNTGANVNMYPSSELIGEFRVSAVNNNAEFAQVGDITVTTKSGSNKIHGSLFEYLQNRALDATTYGALTKPAKVNNTFGASFGGPVVIPHLLDGHDRTFFFADFEGNRLRGDTLQQYLVPTADERAGDLSAFGQTIVNPITQIPYANSKITQISPVATKVLQYYPLPNNPESTSANYVANLPTPASTDGYDVRVDHVLNQRSQIFGRWSWKALSTTGWNSASGTSNSTLLPSSQIEEHNRSLIISHNYTIRPSLLNEFRFGLSLWKNAETFPLKGVAVDTALGLMGMDLSAHPEAGAFPAFNFSDGTGFTPIGRQKDGPTESSTYQFTDNISWSKGHHTLKAGVDYRRLAYQDVEHFDPGSADDFGSFTFYSNAFSGNAFADFLLGLPYDNQVTVTGPNLDSRAQHWGVYGQDEFRWTSRLTVSFGLRWELHAPFTEQKGNITNFDPATGNVIVPDHTLSASPAFLASINACPGTNSALPCSSLVSASSVGLGPGLRKTYFGNFDPRLGIAFRPFSDLKTVFRAGVGIFTASNLGPQSFLLSGIHTADFVDYINYTGPGIAPLFQLPQATYTSTAGAANGNAAFEVAVNTRLRDAESAQWNVTVERELPGASTVRLSYIGMNTYRLQNMVDLNQVRPSSVAYDATRKPYQNWGQVFYSDNNAGANYQAFQAQVDHPYKRGIYLQGSYTWAKSLTNAEGTAPTGFPGAYGGSYTDRFNERGDRGNDYGTRRHRFLLTGIYQLPVGQGHSLLPGAHGITQAVLSGWKLSTITLLQTGPYQTPTISASLDQANINAAGNGASVRPDRIGNGNISKHTPNQWYDINAFQAVAVGAGRDGNSGVGILEGPGTVAVAAGLAKEFSYQEKAKVRFEASFTNLLNHPNFAPPGVNVSNPSTFGVTNSVQTAENAGNRVGQLALRVEF